MNPAKTAFVLSGIGFYAASAYSAYCITRVLNQPDPDPCIKDPDWQKSKSLFDYANLAKNYDWEVFFAESLFMNSKRKRLLSKSSGSVLEVSAGTGRNLSYYPPSAVTSLLLTDKSKDMLQKAWEKRKNSSVKALDFKVEDATRLEMENESYDTVVQTFGLCSVDDPLLLLHEMQRICKKDGQILLLEHGRSKETSFPHYLINSFLDKSVLKHAENFGCWYNRDIEELVRQSGMQVVQIERFHFGTTVQIVARPKG